VYFNYTEKKFEEKIFYNQNVCAEIYHRFKKGKIYKISSENGNFYYIGQTKKEAEARFDEHKKKQTNKKIQKKWSEDVKIEVLDKYLYLDKKDFDAYEKRFITNHVDKDGKECLNDKFNKEKKEGSKIKIDIDIKNKIIENLAKIEKRQNKKFAVTISDNVNKSFFKIQYSKDGKQCNTTVRYNAQNKDEKSKVAQEKRDAIYNEIN
jgi:hypothetical protein